MCVLIFYKRVVRKIILIRNERDMIKKCISVFHVKYPLFFSDFNKTLILSSGFRKILKCKILLKSFRWERSCSMRTDRHDETNSRFSQFCKKHPKIEINKSIFLQTGYVNPLNAELNPICHFLALLGVHHFPHVSRTRVKSLTLRLLMSYIYIYIYIYLFIYMEHLFLMFLDHTQRRTTVGRTPLDE